MLEAVGTATVHVSENDSYRIGYQYQPIVRLHRREDEEAILGKFGAFAEEVGAHHYVSTKSHGEDRNRESLEFAINDADSIERFLAPLHEFLVTNIEVVGVLLGDIFPAVQDGDHLTKAGFLDLMVYAETVRDATRKGPEKKYTREFFENEWATEV